MKEIEELLDKMLLCSEEHLQSGVNEPTKYAELRAEIIKRFDELEAQVEKLKKAIAIRDRIME